MTREEEIKCASKDYVNYLLDKQEYHNENYTEDDIRQAFVKGAIFANRNPDLSSLWHEASEMPKEEEWILIQFDEDSYDALVFCDMNAAAFCTCCKKYGSTRWAYISDLLPKQFGNSKQVKGGEQ